MPSAPLFSMGSVFWTDGEVMISFSQLDPPGAKVTETLSHGNRALGKWRVAASTPGPPDDALSFPSVVSSCLVPLPVSPERHRGVVPGPTDETSTLR